MKKKVVIIGSTGSVGCQCLEIIRRFPDDFSVLALSGGENVELLKDQIQEFNPKYYFLRNHFGNIEQSKKITIEEMASLEESQLVVMAISGSVALSPMFEAVKAGKTIILANKESIVMAGKLLFEKAKLSGANILPVDSEPSAIWQCLIGEEENVSKLILTASGGALRDYPIDDLKDITPEVVLKHPTWTMGPKITIDSSTLLNKAFEVIESSNFFSIPINRIDVLIHPESIIHSLVQFVDGNMKALLSVPDMRFPIQYAMFYPKRKSNKELPLCDLAEIGVLNFSKVPKGKYPLFDLAMGIAKEYSTLLPVLIGADEAAVELFIKGKIEFPDIYKFIEKTVQSHLSISDPSIEDIRKASDWAIQNVYKLSNI